VGRAAGRRRCPPGTRRRRLGGRGRGDADRLVERGGGYEVSIRVPKQPGRRFFSRGAGARREDPLPGGRRPRPHDPERRPRRERTPRRRGCALRVRRRPRGRRRRAVVHDRERRSRRGDGGGVVERQVGFRRRLRPRCRWRGVGQHRLGRCPGTRDAGPGVGDVSLGRRRARRPSTAGALRLNSVSGDLHVAALRGPGALDDAQVGLRLRSHPTSTSEAAEGEAEGGASGWKLRATVGSGDIRITRALRPPADAAPSPAGARRRAS
jgi:hypothetical protein